MFTVQLMEAAVREGDKKEERDRAVARAVEGVVMAGGEFSAHFSITAERSQRPGVYTSCLPFALRCSIGFPPIRVGAVK